LSIARLHGASLGPGAVLDAGCGTGGLLRRLPDVLSDRTLVGIDREPLAARLAAEHSGLPVAIGSVDRLPLSDASLAAIFSADVLYHRDVDETAALTEFRRCLAPGGILVLNLPAYEWLRSAHDRAVHTARRYTAGGLRRRLEAAGFRKITCRYWNSIPFPLMVVRRKLLSIAGETSDVGLLPKPVEAVFRAIMRIENFLLSHRLSLPFGGSVLAVASA
jgi:SAM-dependent methyltransferase